MMTVMRGLCLGYKLVGFGAVVSGSTRTAALCLSENGTKSEKPNISAGKRAGVLGIDIGGIEVRKIDCVGIGEKFLRLEVRGLICGDILKWRLNGCFGESVSLPVYCTSVG